MKTETYEHYATGHIRKIEIIEEVPTEKVGHDKKVDRLVRIILRKDDRWQIKKSSYFLKK